MDDIEKRLYHDLSIQIEIPEKCDETIKGAIKQKKKHYSWIKIATTACASLMITAGVVYAGTKVAETIWKEPEKVVGYTAEETITEKKLKEIMGEEEARDRANEILEKFGYTDEIIKLVETEKYGYDSNVIWRVETNNDVSIEFDAKDGELLSLFNSSVLEKNIDNCHSTKDDAIKTARDLCKRFGYDLNEYIYVETGSNYETEEEAYIWYVDFYKEYDELVDRYNEISIGFIPEINELYYFIVYKDNYENNPVEITEEQAKETSLNAEKNTNISYNIKNVEVELGIVDMNGDAYLRTTDFKQYCEQRKFNYPDEKYVRYYTDKRIRKAWKVIIEYDVSTSDVFSENFNSQDLGYIYYVDATTGEIIGGEEYNKPIIIKSPN